MVWRILNWLVNASCIWACLDDRVRCKIRSDRISTDIEAEGKQTNGISLDENLMKIFIFQITYGEHDVFQNYSIFQIPDWYETWTRDVIGIIWIHPMDCYSIHLSTDHILYTSTYSKCESNNLILIMAQSLSSMWIFEWFI